MNTSSTGKELRELSRINKIVDLRVKQLSYPLTSDLGEPGTCNNISEDGICFSVSSFYKVKERLCLTIDLVGWQLHKRSVALLVNESLSIAPLTIIAEVVWCRISPDNEGIEIGARFLDIPKDDLVALKIHLDRLRHMTVSG